MAELQWTREKPTEPGMYVFRYSPTTQGSIVRVRQDEKGLYRLCYSMAPGHGRWYRDGWGSGWWYGPLPELSREGG